MNNQPPTFQVNDDYELWRINLQQWRMSTDVEPRRQALIVRTKLNGRAREIALNLDAANLNSDFGMDVLLSSLDTVYRRNLIPREKEMEHQRKQQEREEQQRSDIQQRAFEEPRQTELNDKDLTPTERARLRAAALTAKLTKEGKCPKSVPLPPVVANPIMNPADQIRDGAKQAIVVPNHQKSFPIPEMPEVKKKEYGGGYYALVEINDLPARPFLIKTSTHELITNKTGCGVSLRGRYFSPEVRKEKALNEQVLSLYLEADISAKVQVAVHKVMEVNRNYENNPEHSTNNYGLTGNQSHGGNKYQDKLFIGIEPHPAFRIKEKLTGHRGSNFHFIEQQSGGKITLRGKGSGHIDQNSKRESFEAMHIHISHPRQDGLVTARQLCANLVDTVRNEHQTWLNGGQSTNPQQQNGPYGAPRSNGHAAYNSAPPPMHIYQQPAAVFPSLMAQRPMYQPPMVNPAVTGYPPRAHTPFPNMAQQANDYGSPYDQRPHDEERSFHDSSRYRRRSRSRSRSPSDHRRSRSRSPSNRRRDRSRSPTERRRSRSPSDRRRSRSPSSSERRQNKGGSGSNRRSRSPNKPNKKSSPERRAVVQKETKRKFTEEPKKRRKFSEDPKILEQSNKETAILKTIMKPTALSTAVASPPRKGFASPNSLPLPPAFKSKKKEKPVEDIFSSRKSKILKMGALGSLAAYTQDSDDSDDD